jgi:signal transduction histidine kinase/ActR/RegA family two-component response regulator
VRGAEVRLLYENVTTGVAATIVIAGILAFALWNSVSHGILVTWLVYMILVSGARAELARRFWRAPAAHSGSARWHAGFVTGAALAGLGWGIGGMALYSTARPIDEVLVVFAVGGVMLGGASLLAARPEAFLTFLLPTGLLTSLRVALEGDENHLLMGLLCAVFTAATVLTTWRFHRAIDSSFTLRFENQDLIDSLQAAKDTAEALNRDLERRVRERTATLQAEDRRKDEFLATLAHELRNPLAPIRFALKSLKPGTPLSTAEHAREVVERQVAQLVRLVDDLLDVSRITADKIRLRREPVDLAGVMTTAVESIAPLAAAANHTLDVRLPPVPLFVHGDAARLVQVFANVLNNAAKFTPRGGRILFTAAQEAGQATVHISDTGMGIPAETLPRVFEMFHQAVPVLDRSTGGLGIGLTLARRLVEMHQGTIEVASPGVGRGTVVEIRLPITMPVDAGAAPPAEPLFAAGRALRVLIVEDNVDAAEMLRIAVSELGHATRLAHDGAAALAAADAFRPDVIFLDIGLPVMNGYVVARTLREQAAFDHVHIAAVSGWGQDEDRRQARVAGCDSHFTKPLSPGMLERLLATLADTTTPDAAARSPRTRLADPDGT